jgi:tetratricopeptide (TPR) repeat protein
LARVFRRIAFFLAVAAAAAPRPVQSDEVVTRLAPHDGYGRIVFNWPAAVPFSAEADGGRLTVTFQRPIETDLSGAPGPLSRYFGRPSISADRRSVSFPLNGPFQYRAFSLGRAIIVDVFDATAATAQRATTAAAEPRVAAVSAPATSRSDERIGVRGGEHPTYSRIVFDWARDVDYRVNQVDRTVTVAFDRAAEVDTADVNRRPPRYVRGVRASEGSNTTTVTIALAAPANVNHFRAGSKVVIDISPPGTVQPARPDPTAAAPRTEVVRPRSEAPRALDPGRQAAVSVPETPAPARSSVAALATPPASAPAERPVSLTPPQSPAAASATPARAPAAATGPAPGAVTLRFDWDEPVAAAAFRRAGNLWIVFDKAKKVDLDAVRLAGGNAVRAVEQLPLERATVLRLDTVAGVNPTVRRDGFAWIFDLERKPISAATPIESLAQPNSPIGARVFMPVVEAGNAVPMRDPEVGDNIVVVPVVPLGHGVSRRHEFVQFRLLPTAQGVVVEPRIDDLRVRPIGQGIELTSASALLLSNPSTKLEAGAKIAGAFNTLERVIDPDLWREGRRAGLEDLNHIRQDLLYRISVAEGPERKNARYELARFYFGQAYAPETFAVLDQMARDDPDTVNEPQFRLLRGGANFLMHRTKEALSDFGHSSLDSNDEAAFWRALTTSAGGQSAASAPALKRTGSIFRPYPRALKMPIGFQVVESAVAANDIKLGVDFLEALGEESPTLKELDQLAYYEGALKKLAGDFGGAVAAWEEVERGNHRPIRARAIVARAELLLSLKEITPEETITELEKLRFAWRGDDFEFDLLRKLGHLYLSTGDYRSGLRTLRQAATYFSDRPAASQATQEMAEAFEELFLNDAADSMPPVSAIALFEEFKELTPSGEKGDEMIRKLADRLAAVDLLDRAADLLTQQVDFRLKGPQKARVGAQLALVRLIGRDPEKALDAISRSQIQGLPDELIAQRRHLTARALIDLGRAQDALVMLEDDDGHNAERLRTEIYWNSKDWVNASTALRKLASLRGAVPGGPLDEQQAQIILNLAVALTLSGNQRGLSRLRQEYEAAMNATPLKDAFGLIASPDNVGLVDYRNIASKVKEVTDFGTYLAEYRERLKSGQLSRMN